MATKITTRVLADDAVTAAKLAANSVVSASIANGTIVTADLADNSITSAKIVGLTIVAGDIAHNAINANKIGTGIVDATHIAANAVSSSELKSDALSGQTFTGNFTCGNISPSAVTTTGNVGVQDTNPPQKLHIDEVAGFDVGTGSSTSTSQFALDTFTAATFRSAEYTVQITNSTDSDYHTLKISLFHDGSTVYLTQYASIFDNGAQAAFDADISSGSVRLLATPASSDTMAFKFIRTTIEV